MTMTQDNFYKEIVKLIYCLADGKTPDQLAYCVYFHMREHPKNVKMDKAWGDMMKNMKILLSKHLGWKMRDIHRFFTKLHSLTQYMKKSS